MTLARPVSVCRVANKSFTFVITLELVAWAVGSHAAHAYKAVRVSLHHRARSAPQLDKLLWKSMRRIPRLFVADKVDHRELTCAARRKEPSFVRGAP